MATKAKKTIIGKVQSSSNPKVFHTQYKMGSQVGCTCMGFRMQKNCKHLKGESNMATKSNRKSSAASSATSDKAKKVTAVKGKTSRAAMINTLLRQKGKLVSLTSLKAAIQKVTGFGDEKAAKRLKTKSKEVAAWAKQHGLNFIANSNGMKLA